MVLQTLPQPSLSPLFANQFRYAHLLHEACGSECMGIQSAFEGPSGLLTIDIRRDSVIDIASASYGVFS